MNGSLGLPVRQGAAYRGLQEDAAKRLVRVTAGQETYRAINVLLQYYSEPKYCFRVPRTVFYPRPHVDAALTSFCLRPNGQRQLPVAAEEYFEGFLEVAFRNKRKRLRNVLKPAFEPNAVEEALKVAELSVDARAVDLICSQFVKLFLQLQLRKGGTRVVQQ